MAKYIVTYCVTCYQDVEVEANNDYEALDEAAKKVPEFTFNEDTYNVSIEPENVREVRYE